MTHAYQFLAFLVVVSTDMYYYLVQPVNWNNYDVQQNKERGWPVYHFHWSPISGWDQYIIWLIPSEKIVLAGVYHPTPNTSAIHFTASAILERSMTVRLTSWTLWQFTVFSICFYQKDELYRFAIAWVIALITSKWNSDQQRPGCLIRTKISLLSWGFTNFWQKWLGSCAPCVDSRRR